MAELVWDGKYKDDKKQGPVWIPLPFQTIETVNESAQERQRSLELFSAGREPEWGNRLIWGDKKYVLPSLLPEFAGQVSAGIRNAQAKGSKFGRPMRAVDRDRILQMRAEGQSLRQIAKILGVGYGTVRERLRSRPKDHPELG